MPAAVQQHLAEAATAVIDDDGEAVVSRPNWLAWMKLARLIAGGGILGTVSIDLAARGSGIAASAIIPLDWLGAVVGMIFAAALIFTMGFRTVVR